MKKENNLKNKKQIKLNSLLIFFLLIILLILSLFFCVKNKVGRYKKDDYYSQIINNQENAIKMEIDEIYNMIKGVKKVTEFDADITQKYFIYEIIILKEEKYFDVTCLLIKNDPYVRVYINNEIEKVSELEEFAAIYMEFIEPDENNVIEIIEDTENKDKMDFLKKCKYKDKMYEIIKKKNVLGQYDISEIEFKEI